MLFVAKKNYLNENVNTSLKKYLNENENVALKNSFTVKWKWKMPNFLKMFSFSNENV